MDDFRVSERRACRVLGQNRAVQRHTPITRDDEDALTRRIIELAAVYGRYGALRVPSEPLRLTWGDIDFEKSRIRVPSPKAEHHHGKGSRMLPLFPEFRP